jgi:hypothetical protein
VVYNPDALYCVHGQGPAQTIGDPRGGWADQRPGKGQGQIHLLIFVLWCFRTPTFLLNIFVKNIFVISRDFLGLGSVFEFSSTRNRNTPKRDKTKKTEGKLALKKLSIFLGGSFRHGIFVKIICVVCGLWCFAPKTRLKTT